jgi:hypothetical protein
MSPLVLGYIDLKWSSVRRSDGPHGRRCPNAERLDEPEKNWKFSASDVQERKFWSDYMHAFEEAIRATASKHAPWFVVPADNKWFTRLVVAAAIVDAMENLNLAYPKVDAAKKKQLAAARVALSRERQPEPSRHKTRHAPGFRYTQ